MPDDREKLERAAEIQKAIDDVDKKKRADEEAGGQLLDKLLARLDDCLNKLDGMDERLDAMERDDAKRKDAKRRDDDDDDVERPSEEEERKRREELGQEPGEARPVVADTDAKRRHALADAQTRADTVAMSWGQRADPPLAGESLRGYRCRQLRRYQRYSPQYKASDLETITDPAVFDAVELKIYADAALAANSPDSVPAGMLRTVSRRMPGGHTENTFIGTPHAWMSQFAYGRSRFVTMINPKQKET